MHSFTDQQRKAYVTPAWRELKTLPAGLICLSKGDATIDGFIPETDDAFFD